MKPLFTVLAALIFALTATPAFACDKADAAETAANIEETPALTYALVSVKDVSCAGCYVPIRQELTAMKGIHSIEEGEAVGKLVIGYDKSVTITDAQFKAAIKRAGYDCDVSLTAEKPASPAPAPEAEKKNT